VLYKNTLAEKPTSQTLVKYSREFPRT